MDLLILTQSITRHLSPVTVIRVITSYLGERVIQSSLGSFEDIIGQI